MKAAWNAASTMTSTKVAIAFIAFVNECISWHKVCSEYDIRSVTLALPYWPGCQRVHEHLETSDVESVLAVLPTLGCGAPPKTFCKGAAISWQAEKNIWTVWPASFPWGTTGLIVWTVRTFLSFTTLATGERERGRDHFITAVYLQYAIPKDRGAGFNKPLTLFMREYSISNHIHYNSEANANKIATNSLIWSK